MIAYVLFGGMLATTWVQIVKAVLLLGGAPSCWPSSCSRASACNPLALFAAASAKYGGERARAREARRRTRSTRSRSASRSCSAPPGLPHILMRFYTVPDAAGRAHVRVLRDRRSSASSTCSRSSSASARWCSSARTRSRPSTRAATWRRRCSPSALGGTRFLGFIAAVAFATILAVVAGLTLSGRGGALARPLGRTSCAKGTRRERRAARGRARRDARARRRRDGRSASSSRAQNVAYMVGLAFAIAASANFPALVLSIFWRRFTTAGAAASMIVGTVVGAPPHLPVARRSRWTS